MAVPVRSFDEALLRGFLARLDQLKAAQVLTPVITLDRLRESLDDGQRVLVGQVIGQRVRHAGRAVALAAPAGIIPKPAKDRRSRARYVTTRREGIHQLRHYAASVMLAGGVSIKEQFRATARRAR